MAGASLLTLLDDIATLLDDVAAMSKVAVEKTAGVLSDDLAVNAEQVSGVRAAREIPVIWAVAKGSFKNKVIIVPVVMLISAILPMLITPVLIAGGAYLCFEGAEKLLHYYEAKQHKKNGQTHGAKRIGDVPDLKALERKKIKGAIRTDFILSIEIIVITLGTVQTATLLRQSMVVSTVAIGVTVFVYGLVAAIVKIDDVGLYLVRFEGIRTKLGRFLLWFAPTLMKFLAVAGTVAMFLVGGGIITHSFEHAFHAIKTVLFGELAGSGWLTTLTNVGVDAATGLLLGFAVVIVVEGAKKFRTKNRS